MDVVMDTQNRLRPKKEKTGNRYHILKRPRTDKKQVPKEYTACGDCPGRPSCKTLCKKIQAVINDGASGSERHHRDHIELFPTFHLEKNFASLPQETHDGIPFSGPDDFTEGVYLQTDCLETNRASIFVEIFFNKRSFQDLADQLGVEFNTVWSYFQRACERIEQIVKLLDSKQQAVKYSRQMLKFDDDEKVWLLKSVFGFKSEEVSDILGMSRIAVKHRIIKKNKEYREKLSEAV
jgi:DNA-directed RNA polymerase specialized sigma24 family protein